MGKNNENDKNTHVERLDNTQVRRSVLLKKILKASPAKQIESYLKIHGVPLLSILSADTRTPELKEINRKAGELELYRLKEEEQKRLNRLIALGVGATGVIIGSLFTPAAPYVNAALAAHSAANLGALYHEGTLGFNTETALNTLGLTPYGVKALSHITPKSSKQLSVLSEIKPNVRTRVGDVEVDTPANTYIWINSKNASMISDQLWDDAYNTAINVGDYKEAKRLRDLHFQTKSNSTNVDSSGNPIHMYHGSPKTDITEFKHMGSQQGGRGTGEEGFYFTPKYSYAERYKAKHLMKDTNTDEGKIYDIYLNILKPGYFPQDFPEASVKDFYQMSTPTRIAYELNGYDGLHLGRMLNNIIGKRPETVVFKNSQIKSARPITYDDNGKIIPLSKRDDFTNPDIRFGWLAPLFGVSAAASLANSKTKK